MHYRSSGNAWQTRDLLKEWFHKIFVPEVQYYLSQKKLSTKAVLLLDNASAYCCEEELKSSDGLLLVIFFSPNTTAILQSLDQNGIKSLKSLYRIKLLLNIKSSNNEDLQKILGKITPKKFTKSNIIQIKQLF